MYTTHGHHIAGTAVSIAPAEHVAKCGGPIICQQCSREASEAFRVVHESHNEGTLTKLYDSLYEHGIEFAQARDIVNTMQNKGLLIRERA